MLEKTLLITAMLITLIMCIMSWVQIYSEKAAKDEEDRENLLISHKKNMMKRKMSKEIKCSIIGCDELADFYDEMDNPVCESHKNQGLEEDEDLREEDFRSIQELS